jgi:hypothetical protein
VLTVEILFFEGCPNVDVAAARARDAIAAARVSADLRLVRIDDEAAATRLRFLGSPTVHVDGLDVERSARQRTDFGLQCRVYSVDGRLEGAAPVEWIRAALESALPEER